MMDESPKALTIWLLVLAVFFIVFMLNTPMCSAQQIVCNRQPMSGLEYKDNNKKFEAAEWHCTGTAEQALSLLSQNNIMPFTPATVTRLQAFTNKASLREKFLKGAMYIGLVVGPVAALPLEPIWRGIIGGAPIVAQVLKDVAGDLPEGFEPTQASGYSVVYSSASSVNRVIQNQPLTFAPRKAEPLPEVRPASWYVLFQETLYQGRKEVIQNWRGVDENWQREERIDELQNRMNFAEAEVLARL